MKGKEEWSERRNGAKGGIEGKNGEEEKNERRNGWTGRVQGKTVMGVKE
jgi:hypothetical protein